MGVPVPPIGSAGAWTPHGAATLHEAVDDPAASNDGDTTYASVGDGSAADFDIAPLDHPNPGLGTC